MHNSSYDMLVRVFAEAPLTAEQQQVWRHFCAELVAARVRIQELENRVNALSKKQNAEEFDQSVLSRPDFNREAARMLAFDERYKTITSVLYFDIENLDTIRQRHGNDLVSAAVRCVSDALMVNIRRTDVLGRLAPDEFGVLLPRCDNAAAWKKGEQLASALFEALAKSWGPGLKPSISYGAYTFRDKEDVAAGLKKAAADMTRLGKPTL